MGRYIVQIKDMFVEWSSIVDAPVSYGMTRAGMEKYIKYAYGVEGLRDFDKRMERVNEKGTSAIDSTKESILSGNRAGPNEEPLTEEEIYTAYCLRQPIRGGWTA